MLFKLEVIGFNIESCTIAQRAGADRIELCDGPGEGGTTPSYGFIKAARKKLDIELYPIIRPRGGDFLYTPGEFEIMMTDLQVCKKMGCDGIVIGLLHADGSVDVKRCSRLVNEAYPLGVTFHRAFDRTSDPFKAMEDIIETGCERILTSGQKPTALEGLALIAELVQRAGNRIAIMPGSGIRSENIEEILSRSTATEFHTSARTLAGSNMHYKNKYMNEDLQKVSVDEKEIMNIKNILEAQIN